MTRIILELTLLESPGELVEAFRTGLLSPGDMSDDAASCLYCGSACGYQDEDGDFNPLVVAVDATVSGEAWLLCDECAAPVLDPVLEDEE